MSRGKNKSRFPRGHKVARPSGNRTPKLRILIIGDGQATEPNYFRGLKREQQVRAQFSVNVARGKGGSAKTTIAEAKKLQKQAASGPDGKFDEVWCFVDVETGENVPPRQDRRTKSGGTKFEIVLSNPCFEVWVFAHFDRKSGSFLNCHKVCVEVERCFQKEFGTPYVKTDPEIYSKLQPKTLDAIKNARSVFEKDHAGNTDAAACNSSTEVYEYVERLLGIKPPAAP